MQPNMKYIKVCEVNSIILDNSGYAYKKLLESSVPEDKFINSNCILLVNDK